GPPPAPPAPPGAGRGPAGPDTGGPFRSPGPQPPAAERPPAERPVRRPTQPQITDVGLPKRRPRANMAPELRSDANREAPLPNVVAGPRSPDQIRAMMSSFQANFGRGLADGRGGGDDDTTTQERERP